MPRIKGGMAMELSKNALKVLKLRYLRRDAERRIVETPEQLFESVAHGVADAELLLGGARQAQRWQEVFLSLLTSLDFLPNTPTLMNAGKPLGQLSACFVLPVEDSMEAIFEAVKQTALVQRTGGGTGFSFSKLRPKGDVVRSTAGIASGHQEKRRFDAVPGGQDDHAECRQQPHERSGPGSGLRVTAMLDNTARHRSKLTSLFPQAINKVPGSSP